MVTRVLGAVAVLVLVIATGASAQRSAATGKGALIVSGAVSYSSQGGDLYEDNGDKVTTIALLPTALYFVIPGLAVGGEIEYSKTSQGDNSQSITGYGPAVAYYLDTGTNLIPYVGAGMAWGKVKSEVGSASSDLDGSRMRFGGGLLVRRGQLGIALEIGYIKETVQFPSNDVDGNTIAFGIGFVGLFHR